MYLPPTHERNRLSEVIYAIFEAIGLDEEKLSYFGICGTRSLHAKLTGVTSDTFTEPHAGLLGMLSGRTSLTIRHKHRAQNICILSNWTIRTLLLIFTLVTKPISTIRAGEAFKGGLQCSNRQIGNWITISPRWTGNHLAVVAVVAGLTYSQGNVAAVSALLNSFFGYIGVLDRNFISIRKIAHSFASYVFRILCKEQLAT